MVARVQEKTSRTCFPNYKSLDRDRDLNLRPTVVSKFYDTLSNAYQKLSYSLDHIWNCDETRLRARRNCGMWVIARRGSKNVPKILPKSRVLITITCRINAVSAHQSSGFICSRERLG